MEYLYMYVGFCLALFFSGTGLAFTSFINLTANYNNMYAAIRNDILISFVWVFVAMILTMVVVK